MQTTNTMFYKPEHAVVGDIIPYYKDGEFQLFYLHALHAVRQDELNSVGTPWHLVRTRNFINYEPCGEVIPRGSADSQDYYAFTGSVLEADGVYHIYYTARNPSFAAVGKPREGIMHAVSRDFRTWTKVPHEAIFPAADGVYDASDWRDPYVFWNEEAQQYWMLIAARLKEGPERRRGCVALCVSADLQHWEEREPFWAPHLHYTHECPDLFKMGDWWYLVYSEFSERCVTHYRMSRSLQGPWIAPEEDTFDNRAFYAAKTCSDGHKRYAFGWNPTRIGRSDSGPWQWGGHMVVHEIVQQADGRLSVQYPEACLSLYERSAPVNFRPVLGDWQLGASESAIVGTGSFAACLAGDLPSRCVLRAHFAYEDAACQFGWAIHCDDDQNNGYFVRFEPANRRMTFDKWPRAKDLPHAVELERFIRMERGRKHEVAIFIEGTVMTVYFDRQAAMSARMYDMHHGNWGLFVSEGTVCFSDIQVNIP